MPIILFLLEIVGGRIYLLPAVNLLEKIRRNSEIREIGKIAQVPLALGVQSTNPFAGLIGSKAIYTKYYKLGHFRKDVKNAGSQTTHI